MKWWWNGGESVHHQKRVDEMAFYRHIFQFCGYVSMNLIYFDTF